MKKALKNRNGFTLIEIIVVLVIVAILAAVAAPSLLGYIGQARGKAFAAEARVGLTAAQAVVSELIGSEPDRTKLNIEDDGDINPGATNTLGVAGTAATNILATKTFREMTIDVTGAASDLSTTPFSAVKLKQVSGGTTVDPTYRIIGITYSPQGTVSGSGGFKIEINDGRLTVSKY